MGGLEVTEEPGTTAQRLAAPFLDILCLAADPGNRFAADQVATAFLWAQSLSKVDLTTHSAAEAIQGLLARLPGALAHTSLADLQQPVPLLLRKLLGRLTTNRDWLESVLAQYVLQTTPAVAKPSATAAQGGSPSSGGEAVSRRWSVLQGALLAAVEAGASASLATLALSCVEPAAAPAGALEAPRIEWPSDGGASGQMVLEIDCSSHAAGTAEGGAGHATTNMPSRFISQSLESSATDMGNHCKQRWRRLVCEDALAYFLHPRTMKLMAAAQLLSANLKQQCWSGQLSVGEQPSKRQKTGPKTSAELGNEALTVQRFELMCLCLMLPEWHQIITQHRNGMQPQAMGKAPEVLQLDPVRQEPAMDTARLSCSLVKALESADTADLVLRVHPALLAAAARCSFGVCRAYMVYLAKAVAEPCAKEAVLRRILHLIIQGHSPLAHVVQQSFAPLLSQLDLASECI